MSKPKNNSPKPTIVSPMRRTTINRGVNWAKKPTAITGSAKSEISILNPNKLTIHAVIVVPMLAPKMTPNDWYRFSSPALAKPTTITVVALEDWMMLVTSVPQAVAAKRLAVAMPKSWRIFSPDTFCRPSLIIFIPNRKMAKPPNKLSMLSKVDIYKTPSQVNKKRESPATSSPRFIRQQNCSLAGAAAMRPGKRVKNARMINEAFVCIVI